MRPMRSKRRIRNQKSVPQRMRYYIATCIYNAYSLSLMLLYWQYYNYIKVWLMRVACCNIKIIYVRNKCTKTHNIIVTWISHDNYICTLYVNMHVHNFHLISSNCLLCWFLFPYRISLYLFHDLLFFINIHINFILSFVIQNQFKIQFCVIQI